MKRDCPVCGGDGYVSEPYSDTKDTGPPTTICPTCKGEGWIESIWPPGIHPIAGPMLPW